MHEYGSARELAASVLKELQRRSPGRLLEIRVRRGSGLDEGPLRQAFACVVAGTPLDGARLVFEEFCEVAACEGCGRAHRIACSDLRDGLYACPDCGAPRHVDEALGLEVLELTFEEPATA